MDVEFSNYIVFCVRLRTKVLSVLLRGSLLAEIVRREVDVVT